MDKRDTIFLPQVLFRRKDFNQCKKYKSMNNFDDFLEKIKGIGIDVNFISDEKNEYKIAALAESIFISGFSFDNKKDYHHYSPIMASLIDNGVPFVLVTNEDTCCDYIEPIFKKDNSDKDIVEDVKIGCFKTGEIRNEIVKKCEEKSCKSKTKDETLISCLNLLMEKFPSVKTLKRIPIYHYSFMLDLLMWQWFFGEDLFIKRFNRKFPEEFSKTIEETKTKFYLAQAPRNV